MRYLKQKILFIIILILFTTLYIKNKKKYYDFPLNPKRFYNFLKKEEIDMLLNECILFQDSTIVRNGKLIVDKFRTSKTCFISEKSNINKIIKKRIKDTFNLEEDIERLQITHYDPSQYYKPHHDYFIEGDFKNNRQRLKTIFVYLKCPDEGGETNFPLLKKKFIPSLGDAIAWTNCYKLNDKYVYNEKSLHEGSLVKKGEKIGLNIWLLEKNS